MSIEFWITFLAWCSVVNITLLMLWFLAILLLNDFIFAVQQRFFGLSREAFNAVHYGGIGMFKMGLWLFNLTPYLVLRAIA